MKPVLLLVLRYRSSDWLYKYVRKKVTAGGNLGLRLWHVYTLLKFGTEEKLMAM